jgi:Uma2 family endonuclease
MVRTLPDDGKRYEVLDGVLFVSPSPTRQHQRAVRILIVALDAYCCEHSLGETLASPADIEFSPKDLVQPDVFVVPEIGSSWTEVSSLLLACEVLSPSTARADRYDKRRRYQQFGVSEFWIFDLHAQVVERWLPDDTRPEILAGVIEWKPRGDLPLFSLNLPGFFGAVLR